jgi:molecular chaperone GrpE
LQDRYLRLSAEYDNFRKRTLKEKIDLQKRANENLLQAILPVADDFDRAMQSLDDAIDIEAVKEGMKLISGKFSAFLNQQGVKEIETVNKEFDTDMHEAITKIPAPSKKLKGKVVDVVQKGYFLNEKVLRFSKVVIGE